MKNWFLLSLFILVSAASLEAGAQAMLSVSKCAPYYSECLRRNYNKPNSCNQKNNECLVNAGAIQRSDGSYAQMYHEANPRFVACKEKGIKAGTAEMTACMNASTPKATASTSRSTSTNQGVMATIRNGQCNDPCPSGQVCWYLNQAPKCVAQSIISDCDMVGPKQEGYWEQCVAQRQAEVESCETQYMNLNEQCNSKVEETAASCDEKNSNELNNVSDMASRLTLAAGQASVQNACSDVAKLSAAANAGLAAYRTTCKSAMTSCKTSCTSLIQYVNANPNCFGKTPEIQSSTQELVGRCDLYEVKMDQAQQAIQNVGQTAVSATNCSDQTFGGRTEDAAAFGVNNSFANNQVDCSKPEFADNKVCACAKNPNDPVCFNMQKSGVASAQTGGGIDSASRLAEPKVKNMGDFLGGDLPGLPGIPQGSYNSASGDSAAEGKQGSDAVLGAMADSVGRGGPGAAAGEGVVGEDGTDGQGGVSGTYGGGGGLFKPSSAGVGDNGTGSQAGVNPATAAQTGNNGYDLRKFLPGGTNDPRLRGIAGAQGIDGITGPNTDIWKKIQNRYRIVSPSLEP